MTRSKKFYVKVKGQDGRTKYMGAKTLQFAELLWLSSQSGVHSAECHQEEAHERVAA